MVLTVAKAIAAAEAAAAAAAEAEAEAAEASWSRGRGATWWSQPPAAAEATPIPTAGQVSYWA